MALVRLRAFLVAALLLATSAPLLAQAVAPRLTCGVPQSDSWERIPVDRFVPVNGLPASQNNDQVTAYTVDENRAQDLAATNGQTIKLTRSHGCGWTTAFELSPTPTAGQPFSGATSGIVSLGLLGGRVLAAVQEGSGAASRPHVLASADGTRWAAADNGLPAQGAPGLLRVASGSTAYLTISPTSTGGTDTGDPGGLLPPLPGGGTAPTPTGLLYRTTDAGASWTLQTGPADLPGGGTGFSHLDIDPSDTNRLYGLVDGRLLISANGGASFGVAEGSGYSAVTALGPGAVVAFTASGVGRFSGDGGASFGGFRAPAGITSAAYRAGHSAVAIESNGQLCLIEPSNGSVTRIPATPGARRGSLLGDRSGQSSFHALSGHALLRYVDPLPPGGPRPQPAVGDLTVPPPRAGTVTPAVRNVRLPVGTSSLEDFALDLPQNPTPLDLFFLVDVSSSMGEYIDDLKAKINSIVTRLTAAGVDLKVGIGTVGSGPARGEQPYPDAYVYPPNPATGNPGLSQGKTYTKPKLYERLRAIGDTNQGLREAVNRLELETTPRDLRRDAEGQESPDREGQLVALEQLVTGSGVPTEREADLALPSRTAVPPGQSAGFRANPGVRRIVILATNEIFDTPFPTPTLPGSNKPNFGPAIALLNAHRVQVIGFTAGGIEALPDLHKVSGGTRTFTPPGGVAWGGAPPRRTTWLPAHRWSATTAPTSARSSAACSPAWSTGRPSRSSRTTARRCSAPSSPARWSG